ncbi:tail fiber assembly protein [Escherichia coli]|nr:tail fiber assembly protein [Escherichia coli]
MVGIGWRYDGKAFNPPPLPQKSREEIIQAAENERRQLLDHADAVMLDWRTELMLGEISDVNKAKLSAWMAYKNEVKAVDVTTAPEHVNWPVPPEA